LIGGGRIGTLATPDGAPIVERLVAFDHTARSYSYPMLQAPFPVIDYISTLQVIEGVSRKNVRGTWSGQFTAVGIDDGQASAVFRAIYENGLNALAKRLARVA
jgi:hypothetical protein